jgi:WD40 repeat protein
MIIIILNIFSLINLHNRMLPISLPIRLLGQLGYKNLEILRKMFPYLQQRKFTRIDDFYELLICCQTYLKILANSSIKLLLCHRLMGIGKFQPRKEYYFFMAMINRIYRVLNLLPHTTGLVSKFITTHSFNRHWVNSIKIHEIYPIMAVASSSCYICRIKSDTIFEFVSSLENSTKNSCNVVAFHPKLPFLVAGLSSEIVMLVKFNIDGTNPQILNKITIKKGIIWSIVFHPVQPVVYVSNDYGYLMVLQFTPDFSNLLGQTSLKPHVNTINGIAIQRQGRFLATCSDDYNAKISSIDVADCTQIKTVASFGSYRKILCIDIHPTLDLVVAGGDDQTAKIWRIDKDFQTTCIKVFSHPSGVRCVQFDPFNWTLITGCYDAHVRIWNFEGEEKDVRKPIHQFRKPTSSFSSILSIGFSPNRPRILAIGDGEEITISKLEDSKN